MMKYIFRVLFPVFVFSLILCPLLPASPEFDPRKDVLLTVLKERQEKDRLFLTINFSLPEKIHITRNELFYFKLNPGTGSITKVRLPDPEKWEKDEIFRGQFSVDLELLIKKNFRRFVLLLSYQCCNERTKVCYLPSSRELALVVQPEDGKAWLSFSDRLRNSLKTDPVLAFLLVFLAGILASLTPCVYPVIPVIIGYIGGQSREGGFRGLVLSLFLVLGLSLVYSVLGLVAAASGSVFGSLTQTPGVTVFIGLVFTAMALSLFGLYDIRLPSFLAGKLRPGKGKKYSGAFLVGMLTGLVAAPCVGPVLISLLAWISQTKNLVMGFWLLFTFTWGMGLLFILLGTFAGLVRSLPRSGYWMVLVKYFFGLLLLSAAFSYFIPVLNISVLHFFLSLLFLLMAFPVLNRSGLSHQGLKRAFRMILCLAALLFFLSGSFSAFQRITHGKRTAIPVFRFRAEGNDLEAFRLARSENKPVLMDFYADWCSECREMDAETFSRPDVQALLKDYITIRIDLTRQNSPARKISEKYRVLSLPTIILFDPAGNETKRLFGYYAPDNFVQDLKKIK
ncbi:MAG: cytochrome c biogenesis protein CcdA [bacterium]|nr:cytochrome c biogenesis protein CcdA [bacterium]